MTSRNLFFKLIWENLKNRLWAFALIGLGCFFLFPVSAAFMAGNMKYYEDVALALKTYSNDMINLVGFAFPLTVFGICAATLICGMSSFSYLNSKSKVDFYHSIPVRREKIYIANYLCGILLFALPYALGLTLAVIIGMIYGVDAAMLCGRALQSYVLNLIYFILMYTSVVIAAMLTGHIVVGFMGAMVFAFYMPIAASVIENYFFSFFQTYHRIAGEDIFYKLQRYGSPLMEYFGQVENYALKKSVNEEAFAALVVSVVLMAIGCLLYRKRPSEAAGKAMAFLVSKPIIRCPICVLSALTLGLMFWSMQESIGWAMFGIVCGAVISHCVIEIIYHFDFKKLFSHKLQMAGCIVIAVVIFCVFRFDLTGYDRYLPSADQVQSAAVQVASLQNWTSYGEVVQTKEGYYVWKSPEYPEDILNEMKSTDIATVREIAADGIRQAKEKKEERFHGGAKLGAQEETIAMANARHAAANRTFSVLDMGKEISINEEARQLWGGETNITVCYTMKNGKRIYRAYNMLINGIIPQLDRLWNNPEFLQTQYPLMSRTGNEVATIRYREFGEEVVLDELKEENRRELLETYQKEFSALTRETMRTELPLGIIQFATPELETALNWWDTNVEGKTAGRYIEGYGYTSRYDLEIRDYYPVYPSFTETVHLLERYGAKPGKVLKELERISLDLWYYDESFEGGVKYIQITDSKKLDALCEIVKASDCGYYNALYGMENQLNAEFHYKMKHGQSNRSVSFPRGQVPDFVWEELKHGGK